MISCKGDWICLWDQHRKLQKRLIPEEVAYCVHLHASTGMCGMKDNGKTRATRMAGTRLAVNVQVFEFDQLVVHGNRKIKWFCFSTTTMCTTCTALYIWRLLNAKGDTVDVLVETG